MSKTSELGRTPIRFDTVMALSIHLERIKKPALGEPFSILDFECQRGAD